MVLPVLFLADYDLATQVRIIRTAKGLRQKDVAEIANVTQAEVSALERGHYVPPSIRRRILQALGVNE